MDFQINEYLQEVEEYVRRNEKFLKRLKLRRLITLEQAESKLEGLTLYEKPDVEAIEKLLSSDLLEMVKYEDCFYENEKHHIEAYQESLENGVVSVKYNKHKSVKFGRVYCSRSLGAINLRREIRGTIFSRSYKDIDIVNCHPNIYYQIAKVLRVKCPVLKRYVEQRDQILEEVQSHYGVSRDTAKQLFIRLLYLGGFQSWAKDNNIKKAELDMIRSIKYELLLIGDEIVKHNHQLFTDIEEYQKKKNRYQNPYKVKATVISYYVQEIECRILEKVYAYCVENGVIKNGCCSLCYDGIMIEKDSYKAELLDEFNKLIIDEFGLDLKFEQKDMKSYADILDQHIIKPVEGESHDSHVDFSIDAGDANTLEYKLLGLINPSGLKNMHQILNIGSIIKNFKFKRPLSIWLEFCTRVKQDDITMNIKRFEKLKNRHYTTRTLHYLAKQDNKDRYYDLSQEQRMADLFVDDHNDTDVVEIHERYLLDKTKLLTANTKFCKCVKQFFDDKLIKTLSIRSPYDTGKTQLLKTIIHDYNPKRILWLTYRKTLTYDIHANFKHLDVKSYLDRDFTADRLIVQLESLLHLEAEHNLFNDSAEVPKFDLVVLDEAESLLNQFSSDTTFKGKNEETFKFMEQIIKASVKSGKLIALDGDLGSRSYSFLKQFGKSINIKNTMVFNTKSLDIISDRDAFESDIVENVKNGKKLFIPSMSNTYAIELKQKIEETSGNRNVKIYNSTCDDKVKEEDIKDIINTWSRADVVITTPTVEAGVSFDADYFDKIYGVISENSCSQTGFFQMLARVRKVREQDIKILNYSKFKVNKCFPWTFEDVKEGLTFTSTLIEERQYIEVEDTILIKTGLSSYQRNYIYNKVAEMNKARHLFLPILKYLAESKGFTVSVSDEKGTTAQTEEAEEQDAKLIHQNILNARDLLINRYHNEFQDLLKLQKQSKLKEEQQYQLKKHYIKIKTGLDVLTVDLIKKFKDEDHISNFACLIDESNEYCKEPIRRCERMVKHRYVKKIINKLGFSGIYDPSKISGEDFKNNMSATIDYLHEEFKKNKKFNLLLNDSRRKINEMVEAEPKARIHYINTILKKYSIKIKVVQTRVRGEKKLRNFYQLQFLENIDELLEYRMNKGYELHDPDNVFIKPSTIEGYQFAYADQYQMKTPTSQSEDQYV
jgi:hypothetical protein